MQCELSDLAVRMTASTGAHTTPSSVGYKLSLVANGATDGWDPESGCRLIELRETMHISTVLRLAGARLMTRDPRALLALFCS